MKKLNPRWYALLKLLKAAEPPYRITTGLTIPFIFGAYHMIEQPFTNIYELVIAIRDSEINGYPIIQRCHVIGKHVVTVEGKEHYNKNHDKYINFKSDTSNSRLFISSNTQLGKTIEKVSHNLAAEYGDPIQEEEYSWDNANNRWRKFTGREIDLIKSIA